MFKCQRCNSLSKPNEGANRVVTKTRQVIYYDKDGKEQGRGFETVEEKTVCNKCKKEK